MKKSARAKAPAAAAKPAETSAPAKKKDARFTPAMGAAAFVVVVGVVAAVMMFGGGDSSERAEAAAVTPAADGASSQAQAAKPVRAVAGVPGKKAPAKVRPADAPGAPAAPRSAAELPAAVVIEGCLEQTGETFRLKNTSGEDAPKSRSWKSGFLKRGSQPVDVVDWNNRLKNHVGERVSVSGMFVDGEMHVRNLRRVAASCN